MQVAFIKVCLGISQKFKVFFFYKYIKVIFFYFKKLFLILTHQNNIKI